ncbi:MAG TPA: hypothetical protein VGF39_04220, partial [Stellaceae bacterium]
MVNRADEVLVGAEVKKNAPRSAFDMGLAGVAAAVVDLGDDAVGLVLAIESRSASGGKCSASGTSAVAISATSFDSCTA